MAIGSDAGDDFKDAARRAGMRLTHPLIAAVLHDVTMLLQGPPIPGGVLMLITWLDAVERKQRKRRRRG